ncbi:MAG: ABC transporter ATP-binding protein [Ruminococcaceae bacterium]|nr:ABC transporter ATP-binding protein [Oscillospiraceae bacterium]
MPPVGRGGRRGGPSDFRKPKDTKKTLSRLLVYLRDNLWLLGIVVLFIFVTAGAQIAANWLLTPIFNAIGDGELHKLPWLIAALVGVYLAGVGSTFVQSRVMIRLSQNMVRAMRRDLYDHVMTLPVRFFDSSSHGDVMSRFTNDLDAVSESLNNATVQILSSVITLVGVTVSMLLLSPLLTVLTMILVPLMLVVSSVMMNKSRKYFGEQQQALGELNGFIEETVEGQRVVKIFCHEEEALEDFERINENFRKKATLAQCIGGAMMPLMQHINNFSYVLVSVVGGMLALRGTLTFGNIATFLGFSKQFGQPITHIANQMTMLQAALAGAERVFTIMDMESEPADSPDAARLVHENGAYFWDYKGQRIPVAGDVRLTDVTFGYVPEKTVLKNVSLYAKPGQKIAFVGSTGAGKTTITNLLTRFYDIDSGTITIDGIDIKEIALADLRLAQAMVLQDTHLFVGTVMENIRYGKLDATDEECIAAAKLASAHSFIMRLPNGYDTVLEDDGGNLSQGQRQLLNIARAAVADPAILILDEATSSVDTRTELHIEHGMDRLMDGRTTFVIAHRLSTVRNSNAIMVIEKGEILERGDHDDLLAQKGRYYKLYTGQFDLD